MKSNSKLAVATLTGAVLGAAAVQGLHAQAKPPAYVISEIDVTDKEAYAKEYVPLAVTALRDSGQKQLAAGGQTAAISGEPPKSRIVLSVFENIDKAKAARVWLIWKLAGSATNMQNFEFLRSKAYPVSDLETREVATRNKKSGH